LLTSSDASEKNLELRALLTDPDAGGKNITLIGVFQFFFLRKKLKSKKERKDVIVIDVFATRH
jgi:hypothetical protein